MTAFADVLPRLAAAYETGRLTPFLGSGMSMPVCTGWWTFIHRLEEAAAVAAAERLGEGASREDMIRHANRAVRLLKARKPGTLAEAVRKALAQEPPPRGTLDHPPPQTRALARLPWPLVLTTNYDNCYAAAARARFPERPISVAGRGAEDCQRILNSLTVAGRSLLWALQGYLNAPYGLEDPAGAPALQRQLVVGHEEYRRVTYRDLHFRRAFAEVYRQRSLLFLGAGIQETYLQELFGEVMEYYGPGARPHYAFTPEGALDPDFMLARFQIIVLEYDPRDQHAQVTQWLDALADVVAQPPRAPVSWSWGRIRPDPTGHWTSAPDLEVVRGPLPSARTPGECLAVSAGGSGSSFILSEGIQRVVAGWEVAYPEMQPAPHSDYLGEYAPRDVFAVRARTPRNERNLTHIHDASMDLFERVAPRYGCIRMQLLAAGGTDKQGATDELWQVRNFPARFSFVQTVRAWGAWRERNPAVPCRLALHVVLDSVYQDIASGRIDVLELLSARDVRFFVEVAETGGELERRLFQLSPDTRLAEIVRQLQLSPRHWTFEVTPPPSLDAPGAIPLWRQGDETLQELGVLPGSTIHFRRQQRRQPAQ